MYAWINRIVVTVLALGSSVAMAETKLNGAGATFPAPIYKEWIKEFQKAHPDVKIQVRDKVIPVRARTATAEEKRRVWRTMTEQWPDYDKYQSGTKRDIPVVLLTPR